MIFITFNHWLGLKLFVRNHCDKAYQFLYLFWQRVSKMIHFLDFQRWSEFFCFYQYEFVILFLQKWYNALKYARAFSSYKLDDQGIFLLTKMIKPESLHYRRIHLKTWSFFLFHVYYLIFLTKMIKPAGEFTGEFTWRPGHYSSRPVSRQQMLCR